MARLNTEQLDRVLWLAVLILGLTVTVCLWLTVESTERKNMLLLTETQVESVAQSLQSTVQEYLRALNRMAERWQIAGGTPEKLWRADAKRYLQDQPGYQAIEYTNPSSKEIWIEPHRVEQKLGVALSETEEAKTAIEQAITNGWAASQPLSLREGQRCFLLVLPIMQDRDRAEGFLIGVVRFDRLVQNVLKDTAQGFDVCVFDGEEKVFGQIPETRVTVAESETRVAGTTWTVLLSATPETVLANRSALPLVTLICGVAVSVLLSFLFGLIRKAQIEVQRRTRAEADIALTNQNLENLVTERTTELANSNRDLNVHIEELDNFVYVASHDLRSPLRAINNLATWLEEDAEPVLPNESIEHLRLIRNRITRMDILIDGLLAYSRAGREKERVQQIDLHELVTQVVRLANPPEGFQISVSSAMPTLFSQKLPLKHTILNLVTNAVQHHDRVDGKVDISARDLDDFVEIVVKDDGPGIDPLFHHKIFEIFQTLQQDSIERAGIGLTLVKKAVESRGGCVSLESKVGAGTLFRIRWPKSQDRSEQTCQGKP